jgi:hypothetical protein
MNETAKKEKKKPKKSEPKKNPLLDKIKEAPRNPGVYQMKDSQGRIL